MARAGQYGTHSPHPLQRSFRITNCLFVSKIASSGHIYSQTPQSMQSELMMYPHTGARDCEVPGPDRSLGRVPVVGPPAPGRGLIDSPRTPLALWRPG